TDVELAAARKLGVDPQAIGIVPQGGASTGAMLNPRREALLIDTHDVLEATSSAPITAFGRARFDSMGQLKSSPNTFSPALGGEMAEDAVGNADRSRVTTIGATEKQGMLERQHTFRFYEEYNAAFREWSKDMNWYQRLTRRGEFNELVTRAVRNEDT